MKSNETAFGASVRAVLFSGAALACLAASGTAWAQDTGADDEADFGNEIIVTATKREQTLQDVPVAVSVTTAETIERAQIRDLKDLVSVVPSLRTADRQNSTNTSFFIRGFGNGANNAGIEPSVGVFVDGVYRSRTASQIGDLPDVARIEVLRGPQSTLFGKNASAGVISIVTQKPKFDFGGNVEASYGNYNAIVVKGVVTGPVSDGIAVSLAGGINKRDGYVKNLAIGTKISERDRWFVRGQVLFEPNSDLSIRLIGDYDKIDERCCGVFNVRPSAATALITSPLINGKVNSASNIFRDEVYFNYDPTNKVTNWGGSGQIDYDLGGAKLTSITAYRRTKSLSDFDTDFTSGDIARGAGIGSIALKTFTQELRLTASLGDRVDLLLGGFYFNEKVRQTTSIKWGTQARTYFDRLLQAASGGAQSIPTAEVLFGNLTGNPTRYVGQFFREGTGVDEAWSMKDENFSIFGQVDFEIADGLTLTGGLNYTDDKKRFVSNVVSSDVFASLDLPALRNTATNAGISQTIGGILGVPGGFATPAQIAAFAAAQPAAFQQISTGAANATLPILGLRALQVFPPFVNLPNATENGRTADNKLTYTARLAYDINDRLNMYLSYATGFKASSVNLSRDSRPNARAAGPENSTVYELGMKGNWGLASANVAVFYQSIKGFQSNIFNGLAFLLANAGKQSTWGMEFEGSVRPVEGLSLGVAVTYLDPKYNRFPNSAFGDVSGTRPADIPGISSTFSAQYDHEMGNGDHIIAQTSYHYESAVQVVEGMPGFITKNPITGAVIDFAPGIAAARPYRREVDMLDASLTYAMANGLELTVWGRNLLDDRYISTVFDSTAQSGSISAYTNQPRTYGIAARFRW